MQSHFTFAEHGALGVHRRFVGLRALSGFLPRQLGMAPFRLQVMDRRERFGK